MKPYYERDGITLFLGDCREVLPTLDNGSAGLMLADPPYNVGKNYGTAVDDNLPPTEYEWLCDTLRSEGRRLAPRMLVTPGLVNLPIWTRYGPSWVYCWLTATTSMGGSAAMHMGWEPIISFGFPLRPLGTDVMNFPVSLQREAQGHPCPKPLRLFRYLIERWTAPGDLVIDPMCGSGTALRAAKDLGRRAIGIEISEPYAEITARRLAQGVMAL